MPLHPIAACYCHIVESGLVNLQRQLVEGAVESQRSELWHLQEVNRILTLFLLYSPHDPRWNDGEHERYWKEVRPKYIAQADKQSLSEHQNAWEFLASVTLREEDRKTLEQEGRELYK